MFNKCKKCGFIYGEDDIFCARCGQRLDSAKNIPLDNGFSQFDQDLPNAIPNYDYGKHNFIPKQKTTPLDSPVFAVGVFLFVLMIGLSGLMYYLLNGHQNQKQTLQYKNLSNNPAQIPYLKDPISYRDLAINLREVEDFLLAYLQQSRDPRENKEQIFASYLTEMDKMPNVLLDKSEYDTVEECSSSPNGINCASLLNNYFEYTSLQVFNRGGSLFLYPDYKNMYEKFAQYLSSDFAEYLELCAKYNIPVSFKLSLNIKPKTLANKIYDFEELYLNTDNTFIKDEIEKVMYNDVRKFIFTPSIYATQTQEMKKEFKDAYQYFISNKTSSALRPLFMSYMDKKRSYSEENFKNDYPYKIFEGANFEDNVQQTTLKDIFPQLRKSFFAKANEDENFVYIFDSNTRRWKKYDSQLQLQSGEFVISEKDENNNVSIYNHLYSPMQELNILKHSKMFLVNDYLYVYNADKLSISKINYNGKTFSLYNLNHIDVTSLFPGVEVINIDSFPSYNILIEKPNASAGYIILSRYSQGWADYNITPISGSVSTSILPNMFMVDSMKDVVFAFQSSNFDSEGFSENKPSYKFRIKTHGYVDPEELEKKYIQFDEQTYSEQLNGAEHQANIMPKVEDDEEESQDNIKIIDDNLIAPPRHTIDPPFEFE